jgi:hypothetical protein
MDTNSLCRRNVIRGCRRHRTPALSLLAAVLFILPPSACWGTEAELYGSAGVRPEAVRQGGLGSCYFFATLSALAQASPQVIQKLIQDNNDGSYTVQFPDGKKETAYPEDLRYARESGFDRSDGLWPIVLFRAYAQRVLRESLLTAIEGSNVFPLLKSSVRELIASKDFLLLAYDRAIRAGVDQSGNVDQGKLEAKLKEHMKPLGIPETIQNSLVEMLRSKAFFDSIVEMVKQNGELFGAYRAVGQGGLPERAILTLTGKKARYLETHSRLVAGPALALAVKSHQPIIASSREDSGEGLISAGRVGADAKDWYAPSHAYTVLGYETLSGHVKLRNPWGNHPDPDGIFTLPLATFVAAFDGITTASR